MSEEGQKEDKGARYRRGLVERDGMGVQVREERGSPEKELEREWGGRGRATFPCLAVNSGHVLFFLIHPLVQVLTERRNHFNWWYYDMTD